MNQYEPLASRVRPSKIKGFVGQEKLVGKSGIVKQMLEAGNIFSMIFWGPPGSGKTTLARIIAEELDIEFRELSAVESGVKDVREVYSFAKKNKLEGRQTILFLDEVHRFNKAQQDALLPHVENGTIIFIGATTENPSFGVISPLLSRCRVFVFEPYSKEELLQILDNALKDKVNGLGKQKIKINKEAKTLLANISNGDPRFLLNTLEIAVNLGGDRAGKGMDKTYHVCTIDIKDIEAAIQKKSLIYDKKGEEHYNLISALHKSMRSSDVNATIYWTERMIASGEDPLFIARRIIRFASEDIGLTNNNALLIANAAYDACKNIGLPECNLALVQAAVYMAKCEKDNRLYKASNMVKKDIDKTLNQPVPLHLRNAPTKLMKDLDYGKGYIYDHDLKSKKSGQQCLPDELVGRDYWAEKS